MQHQHDIDYKEGDLYISCIELANALQVHVWLVLSVLRHMERSGDLDCFVVYGE